MNTFFISPKIPLSLYLLIQKNKNNLSIDFNENEQRFLKHINKLFNYSKDLTISDQQIIKNIIVKISNYKNEPSIIDKLQFTNLNTYKEITNYNSIFYNLLKERNFHQITNPYSVKSIDLSVGLSDIGPLSNININKFNNIPDDQKIDFIMDLINDKYIKSKIISQDIISKSIISSKINSLTRILSNKSILYSLLKNESFIPSSSYFERNMDDIALQEIIDEFKDKSVDKEYFVIKPSAGTLSDGLGIFKIEELTLDFIRNWISNPGNNQYAINNLYETWILSDFIQSFLWKLNGTPLTIQKFGNLGVLKNIDFNDTVGRINKFRFWCLWTINNNQFTSYLYKDGYCEIALEELNNFTKTELDPSNIEEFYQNYYDIEEDPYKFENIIKNGSKNNKDKKLEAATVGTYLDFARVVNEDNYPLGKEAWINDVLPNMIILVNSLINKTKRYLSCLNKYQFSKKTDSGCFSYFALDIIIDKNNKPWLLEANSRPFIGFEEYWNKYDPNNHHAINVTEFINSILQITIDPIFNNYTKNVDYNNLEKFIITNTFKIRNSNKLYLPLTLGIDTSQTSSIYNKIYNILDKNNYKAFPYPKYVKNYNQIIAFRGMSPITKYLISKIAEIENDKFLQLMRDLFPYDAKVKLLNRIATLGFYLGDKVEMTNILKSKIKNWDTIIPFSITINLNDSNNLIEILKTNFNNSTIIAKPAYGQQGKGIMIDKDHQKIIDYIQNSDEKSWVLSKYLDDPYLIKLNKIGVSNIRYDDSIGRKCHIRAYVLVYRNKKTLQIYLYKNSLIFCAAKEYNSCSNNEKDYCNLTNLYFGSKYYAEVLNKNPADAYKDLSVKTNLVFNNKEYNILLSRIKYIIKTTIYACKDNLLCLNKNNECFQYIAFDFHLENNDGYPEPWLLEVNGTPGLKAPNYQWQDTGGVNNFLESILNIVISTKISKPYKQLFEYLPHRLANKTPHDKIVLDNIKNFETIDDCVQNSTHKQLKQMIDLLNLKNKSSLKTKKDMCSALMI